MAQNTEKGFVERFLQRTDGGLLTLNLATLTFVAGLQKLGDLKDVVNLRILVGGLCVGLFAAILCAYFTEFGTRAATAGSRNIGARVPFHTDLVLGSARPGGGWLFFAMFAVWIALSILPARALWQDLQRDHKTPPPELTTRASNARKAFASECGPAARSEQAVERRECLRDQIKAKKNGLVCSTAAARMTYEAACLKSDEDAKAAEKARDEAQRKIDEARNGARNSLLILSILFYLSLPLLGWLFGVVYAAIANRWATETRPRPSLTFDPANKPELAPPSFSQKATLCLQVDAIQSLRLAAAMISLAAFMIGVGLALVNTGVTNFNSGFAETAPSLPAPIADGSGISGGSGGAGGAGGAAHAATGDALSQGGSAYGGAVTGPSINIPDRITLNLDYGERGKPSQTVVLEGLDKVDLSPKITVPPSDPPQTKITVLPAPTPPAPPPPPSPDEIAGALEKRVAVRHCEWDWRQFPPRRCSYKLGAEPAWPEGKR